ncbi:unnamed protein product [Amaranthus hypochondriacus]
MPYKFFSNTAQHSPPSSCILINPSSELLSSTNLPSSLPCTDPPAPLEDQPSPAIPLRRSSRPTSTPSWHVDYAMNTSLPSAGPAHLQSIIPATVSPSYSYYLTKSLDIADPTHFTHVVSKPNWVATMNEELSSLELNDTWDVTHLPPHK